MGLQKHLIIIIKNFKKNYDFKVKNDIFKFKYESKKNKKEKLRGTAE